MASIIPHTFARIFQASCILAATTLITEAKVETYSIDTAHSAVAFKVRHFLSHVPGNFSAFEGTITLDRDNLENSSVEVLIQAASIDTNNVKRDNHMQEDDYFHTGKYPHITFKSTQWKKTGENTFIVTGNLSMLEETQSVDLNVELIGFADGFDGAKLSGWHVETTLDRSDWGLTSGRPAVGLEVEVDIDIEAVLQE